MGEQENWIPLGRVVSFKAGESEPTNAEPTLIAKECEIELEIADQAEAERCWAEINRHLAEKAASDAGRN